MLPQIGSSELLVVAIIALIVIGPKDLPGMLRKLGQFVGRLRGMANEFRSSFDEMARQSELDELRREVAAMREASLSEQAAMGEHLENINNQIEGDLSLSAPEDHPPLYDPNYTGAYDETPAEKVLNRRKKVAAAEGTKAKTPAKIKAAAKAAPAKAKAATKAEPKVAAVKTAAKKTAGKAKA